MSDLRELYQQVILDHSKKPRNYQKLECANRTAEGHNPLCGDQFTIYLKMEGDVIRDIGFEGAGCAISKASASMMTTSLKGKKVNEAKELFDQFHKLVLGELKPDRDPNILGKLAIFSGVWQYPARAKCATLAWHTMKGALNQEKKAISTE